MKLLAFFLLFVLSFTYLLLILMGRHTKKDGTNLDLHKGLATFTWIIASIYILALEAHFAIAGVARTRDGLFFVHLYIFAFPWVASYLAILAWLTGSGGRKRFHRFAAYGNAVLYLGMAVTGGLLIYRW